VEEIGENDFVAPSKLDFASVDVEDLTDDVTSPLEEADEPLGLQEHEVVEVEDNFLQSKLISNDIMENYKRDAMKLTRKLANMDFANHHWRLIEELQST